MIENTIKQSKGQGSHLGMKKMKLAPVIREGAETCRALIEKFGNTLVLDIPEELPPVFGSADTLLLVLSNLISNATRYTQNGTITVSAKISNATPVSIIVSVSDTGAGIKPELLPFVFQRGVSEKGSGLGLSICKRAIETHGGTVDIESKVGEGTTVYFSIPAMEEETI